MINSNSLRELLHSLPTIEAVRAEKARRSIEREMRKELAKSAGGTPQLIRFIAEAWPIIFPEQRFERGWHLDFLAMHLEAVTTGRFLEMGLENRLLENVPPG